MIRFDERMDGWVSFTERDFNQAMAEGRQAGRTMSMRLHVELDEPEGPGRVSGHVRCDELGGRLDVLWATWTMLAPAPDTRHRRMRYRLLVEDPEHRPLTISGFKAIEDDPGYDSLADVTTLFVRVLAGHVRSGAEERPEDLVATGILRLRRFGRQLASMRGDGTARFTRLFLGGLWRMYAAGPRVDGHADFPSDPSYELADGAAGRPGWHDVPERPGLRRRVVPLTAGDGVRLNLHHLRRDREPGGPPVILAHGGGGRANVWYASPQPVTIADALIDAGYDVWALNWRGSIDLAPRPWSLDEVAVHDHPAAVRAVAEATGSRSVRAVVQCQGSTSFTMSAIAGLVPQVSHVLSGAVSLHPVVPRRAHLKTAALLPVLGRATPWLDAQWALRAPTPLARAVGAWARLVRRECDDPVCAMANHMFGHGGDLLWAHDNLEQDTHRWLSREFGYAPVRFYRQIHRSVRAGHLVPVDGFAELPASLVAGPPQTSARFTFACGARNRLFLPVGQWRSFAHFDHHAPGRHRHVVWRGHTHLDPWLSRRAPAEVFPGVIDALAA